MEYLNSIDTDLFLSINSMRNAFFDPIMYWLSDKLLWIPMYLLIIFLMVRQYRMRGVMMLLFVILTIALCDQTASGLLKNLVQRLRPSHDPALSGLIYISKAGPGGLYGFVSSHAANCFGLATFIFFAFDKQYKLLKYWLIIWAILVSYSRIYNGVHYPGDVICGGFIGILYGWLMAISYLKTDAYLTKRQHAK